MAQKTIRYHFPTVGKRFALLWRAVQCLFTGRLTMVYQITLEREPNSYNFSDWDASVECNGVKRKMTREEFNRFNASMANVDTAVSDVGKAVDAMGRVLDGMGGSFIHKTTTTKVTRRS